MFKITPNPPETDDVSPYETPDSKKLNEAAERALDYYLKPSDPKPPRKPSTIYTVAPDINIEELLANACESFASAKVIASDCAGFLEGPQRNTILGVAQLIMFGELAVSRALDSLELKADPAL
ncbi:hypothetical protein ACVK1X_005156 [Pseudomonas sp. PvR086]|uniref:DUF6124 family protein n=2 Tax=Pseudomonas TaxID=286 RepID=UPI000B34FC78|nr:MULTISPECIES: DUF6124 family protein [Pseudomonas]MBD9608169.1 hypothetical protein [Pseudomonas sp. PDM08]MDR7109749.1 hypothetical protein [Pseudomonas frederiksbergensis]PMY56972.1 hypothetical protein C1X70_01085 [Pseudomonas sp. FW305-53]PMY83827.1 hypothetical protein C1X68_27495 [Pseudomonas sp. FW303-C2]PNA89930.1 hypothetical protein C1X66_01800 [Pseudomonas sp. MPR-R3B]